MPDRLIIKSVDQVVKEKEAATAQKEVKEAKEEKAKKEVKKRAPRKKKTEVKTEEVKADGQDKKE